MATKITKLHLTTASGVEFDAEILRTQGYITEKMWVDGDECHAQRYEDDSRILVTIPKLSVTDHQATLQGDGLFLRANINGKVRPVKLVLTEAALEAIKSNCAETLDLDAKTRHENFLKENGDADKWYQHHSRMMANAMED